MTSVTRKPRRSSLPAPTSGPIHSSCRTSKKRRRSYDAGPGRAGMKLGVQLNSFDWTGGPERFGRNLADIGKTAEEAGFDRIGVADHFWQHPIMGGPEADEPECYTTLAFLAANTRTGQAHRDGVWGALPPPCRPRKGRHHAGRALRRARLASASAPATTKRRRADSASPSRRRGNVSRCSRRRSR